MRAEGQDEPEWMAGLKPFARRWRQVRFALGFAGTVRFAALALASCAAVDYFASRRNDQLVHDLPAIENVELYRHVDSVEFLRRLDAEGLFVEEVEDEI